VARKQKAIMKGSTLFILLALLLVPTVAPALNGEEAELQKLADGIYAFVDHVGGAPLFSPPATVIVHDRVAKV
jgi:hypothetical protein